MLQMNHSIDVKDGIPMMRQQIGENGPGGRVHDPRIVGRALEADAPIEAKTFERQEPRCDAVRGWLKAPSLADCSTGIPLRLVPSSSHFPSCPHTAAHCGRHGIVPPHSVSAEIFSSSLSWIFSLSFVSTFSQDNGCNKRASSCLLIDYHRNCSDFATRYISNFCHNFMIDLRSPNA